MAAKLLVLLILPFALLASGPPAGEPPLQDSGEERVAKMVARKLVVDFLAENEEIEVEGEGVEAKASAVEPAEELKVEVEDLLTGPGHGSATIKLDCPFRIEAKVKRDGEPEPVSGVVDLQIELASSAEIRDLGDSVTIHVKVSELKGEAGEIREIEPADFTGAKQLVDDAIRELDEKLLTKINDWLEKNAFDASQVE